MKSTRAKIIRLKISIQNEFHEEKRRLYVDLDTPYHLCDKLASNFIYNKYPNILNLIKYK